MLGRGSHHLLHLPEPRGLARADSDPCGTRRTHALAIRKGPGPKETPYNARTWVVLLFYLSLILTGVDLTPVSTPTSRLGTFVR